VLATTLRDRRLWKREIVPAGSRPGRVGESVQLSARQMRLPKIAIIGYQAKPLWHSEEKTEAPDTAGTTVTGLGTGDVPWEL